MNRIAGLRLRILGNNALSAIMTPFSENYNDDLKLFPELINEVKNEADSFQPDPTIVGVCCLLALNEQVNILNPFSELVTAQILNYDENRRIFLFQHAPFRFDLTPNISLQQLGNSISFVHLTSERNVFAISQHR